MTEEAEGEQAQRIADSKRRNNIAAGGLLIAALALLTASTLWISMAGLFGSLTGEGGAGRFLVMVLGTKFDARIWVGIAGILAVGAAYVAGGGLSDRLFYAIVSLAAVSLLSTLFIMGLVSDDETARHLYNYAPERIADADSFRIAANWVIGELLFWLVGVIGTQVRVRKS
jgi:hypothetical protein